MNGDLNEEFERITRHLNHEPIKQYKENINFTINIDISDSGKIKYKELVSNAIKQATQKFLEEITDEDIKYTR